eukprot:CAMPEP_0180657620 /NCGR_PEP_ID=MMETSP1037_2-20121125/56524_1 /TAXON_ID=632150 /ORGANISM="Azadinium spinosum, Strain 3D9" /LENGTH=79 /DNA_ID=CAMNT_0022684365 /DNA_START=1 /DNA_END=237 /DNA_ORIENTATION=-
MPPTATDSRKQPHVPKRTTAMGPLTTALASRTKKSIITVPMPTDTTLKRAPPKRPVKVMKPRSEACRKTVPPGSSGSKN